MTKHLKFFVLALSAIAFSCSEDEAPEKPNQVIVNGNTLQISQAYTSPYTNTTTNQTYHYIYFTTEGVSMESNDFVGTGKMLNLFIEKAGENSQLLETNTYTSDNNDTFLEYYSINNGDWDFESETDLDQVKVTKSGDTYTFEFSSEGTNDYTLHYKGSLVNFEGGR